MESTNNARGIKRSGSENEDEEGNLVSVVGDGRMAYYIGNRMPPQIDHKTRSEQTESPNMIWPAEKSEKYPKKKKIKRKKEGGEG
ncbi:uncharacterized protein SPSK_10828 [Sporothrix schenckii 1099-18]|uniref:Uncharacterized protein n=1 Tax=Sporothrix schenckii 1099-18 TaxID=1397361 RepID=A0A0F2MFZ8_SPOSC|nr:uncharacterized protein SPSK_10828 [Sporothrix schenckii 1099-18]KJR87979.1 hypothetical protein SPSK_10828 [Sporothrix schenckii 1099-18]